MRRPLLARSDAILYLSLVALRPAEENDFEQLAAVATDRSDPWLTAFIVPTRDSSLRRSPVPHSAR